MVNPHTQLVNDILVAVSATGRARVWKNQTGKARAFDDPARVIVFGLPGSADILGIRDDGKFIAIEVKTGTGRLSPKQIIFKAMVEAHNGIYIEARSIDDALKFSRGN